MRVLGMISGTSHDGIDAAVVDFDLVGDVLHARILDHATTPYDPVLRTRLRAALPPAPTTLDEVCRLDTAIGQAFADVAVAAIERAGGCDLVTSHGQTVFHWVEDQHCYGTLQLGAPAWIAERVGCPVVADVRTRDITVGGHAAPLVPLLDRLLVGADRGVTVLLNLGGISNLTVVDDGRVTSAFDIGPANALLDAAIVAETGADGFDDGGALAAAGTIDERLLAVLLDEPYYRVAPPKSTGKELFHADYLAAARRRAAAGGDRDNNSVGDDDDDGLSLPDVLATLVELTALTVAEAVGAVGASRLVVAGGGVRNEFMLRRLGAALPTVEFTTTAALGVPTDVKEAVAFAVIGWCTLHGLPGNEPAATGAIAPRILGAITPGAGPLHLPAPAANLPRVLVVEAS